MDRNGAIQLSNRLLIGNVVDSTRHGTRPFASSRQRACIIFFLFPAFSSPFSPNVELFSSIESHGGRTIPICLGIYFPPNKKAPFQPYPTRIREYGRSIKIVRELPWNRWTPPRSSGYFVLKAPRGEIRTRRGRGGRERVEPDEEFRCSFHLNRGLLWICIVAPSSSRADFPFTRFNHLFLDGVRHESSGGARWNLHLMRAIISDNSAN